MYEMHIGTFTSEGTWDAARAELKELAEVGITCIEVMPIAEFSGRWGWGYDGVDLFAPFHHYGSPDDARRFINEAHRLGLSVILDVVYNHLGPDGNYLASFADEFFTDEFETDWGEAINFASEGVREFYLANGAYWIEEFHFDGLRLDATQNIYDNSPEHILAALTKRLRKAAGSGSVYIVAENEPQNSTLVRPLKEGGCGIDALWNDDFHHSALVALTGRNEAYYTDYLGKAQEFVSAAKYGYLYQGQWYKWQQKKRGSPAFDLMPWNFVTFLQNHDQVANSATGERPNLLAGAGLYRAMSALLMLGPGTPMLFQGQEFGSTSPFLFFCDHEAELCGKVNVGRREFLAQFPSYAQPDVQESIAHAGSLKSFESSKLDLSEREKNTRIYLLYKDLIRLRATDPVFAEMQDSRSLDGAVLSDTALVLRLFSRKHGDRVLLVNLGRDLCLEPAPEPLLAPPPGTEWALLFSTEDLKYGGSGTVPPDGKVYLRLAGNSAIVLLPRHSSE
jgi:maltooligosyltrehalose trehalohydrolase